MFGYDFFDLVFIVLLFGIPIILSVFSLIFYYKRRLGLINKLDYSRYSSKEINRYIRDKNLFVEYNHMWRLIKNVEHATLNIINECKVERDIESDSYLRGIIDEIKTAERDRRKLLFRRNSTKLLYMHRTLNRIQHLYLSSSEECKANPEFIYLHNLIQHIDKYMYHEHEDFLEVNASDYIEARIDPTIMYYNDKTLSAAILFTCFSIVQIIYSALIPVSLLISNTAYTTVIGALYGAFLTITSSINAFCKFKERWIQYHELRDKLLTERNLYISDYSHKDYVHFVDSCEKIISLEHKNLTEFLSGHDIQPERAERSDND